MSRAESTWGKEKKKKQNLEEKKKEPKYDINAKKYSLMISGFIIIAH